MQIGIDLGGSHIAVGVIADNGKIVAKKEQDLNIQEGQEIEQIRDTMVSLIQQVLKEVGAPLCVLNKIGIACPGEVKEGKANNIYNLGLKELPLEQIVQEFYQVEVGIRNDAKCAGLAEKKYGSLQSYEDAVFLCLGTGIGGATFLKGELLKPYKNAGSEYGHMVIQKEKGIPCKCGRNGCFEKYCSMQAFKEEVKKILNLPKTIEAKYIIEKIKENRKNEILEQYIENYIENLYIGLANIVRIIEPQAISLGGSFVYYKDILYTKLLEKIEQKKYLVEMPKIVLASLGNDAGMIGAVL